MRHLQQLTSSILLLVILASCESIVLIPASPPPQIQESFGEYFTVAEGRVITKNYSFAYPSDWQVIRIDDETGLKVSLISPDNELRMLVHEDTELTYNEPYNVQLELDTGVIIRLSGEFTPDRKEDFEVIFQFIASSLR